MRYFDSHAHYYDGRFEREWQGDVDDLIASLLSSAVSHIVNVGTSPDTCRAAVAQCARHPGMHTALGIHPTDCQSLPDPQGAMAAVEEMISDPTSRCVCLGEIGLDYHYPDTDREKQLFFFRAQMEMAERLSLPVCIHDRDAHEDVLSVVRDYPRVTGVLHSYSGSPETALEYVRRGYYISFSGTLTFTNARRPKQVAAVLPHDRVLIETDCPYLAPHPLRGTLNHSGNLAYTCAALAEVWGIPPEDAAALTDENARRFFRLDS